MTDTLTDIVSNASTALDTSPSPITEPSPETPTEVSQEAETADPEAAKDVRVARALAQATKKERRAAERERQAFFQVKQAETRIKAAEAARDELNGLLTDAAKNPDKALALLAKAGIPNLDALARLVMQMEPAQEPADKVAQRALKEAQDLRQQLDDERKAIEVAKQEQHVGAMRKNHLAKVNTVIAAAGEDFALVQDANLQSEVLDRIYALLQKEQITDVSEDEEVMLVKHFAKQLEEELAPKARTLLERLGKINKMGINPNTNSGTIPGSPNQATNSDTPGTDIAAIAASVIRDKKPSKFITNETTVSSKPLPRQYNLGRKDDDAIQQALRAMEGK